MNGDNFLAYEPKRGKYLKTPYGPIYTTATSAHKNKSLSSSIHWLNVSTDVFCGGELNRSKDSKLLDFRDIEIHHYVDMECVQKIPYFPIYKEWLSVRAIYQEYGVFVAAYAKIQELPKFGLVEFSYREYEKATNNNKKLKKYFTRKREYKTFVFFDNESDLLYECMTSNARFKVIATEEVLKLYGKGII